MPRTTDARGKALETAERLFRTQGYTATGLTQILEESGAPPRESIEVRTLVFFPPGA